MSIMENWNRGWEGWVVRLVPHSFNKGLEGASSYDRDMCSRVHCAIIRTEKQYDMLCCVLGEWGYCVEITATFKFVG